MQVKKCFNSSSRNSVFRQMETTVITISDFIFLEKLMKFLDEGEKLLWKEGIYKSHNVTKKAKFRQQRVKIWEHSVRIEQKETVEKPFSAIQGCAAIQQHWYQSDRNTSSQNERTMGKLRGSILNSFRINGALTVVSLLARLKKLLVFIW